MYGRLLSPLVPLQKSCVTRVTHSDRLGRGRKGHGVIRTGVAKDTTAVTTMMLKKKKRKQNFRILLQSTTKELFPETRERRKSSLLPLKPRIFSDTCLQRGRYIRFVLGCYNSGSLPPPNISSHLLYLFPPTLSLSLFPRRPSSSIQHSLYTFPPSSGVCRLLSPTCSKS